MSRAVSYNPGQGDYTTERHQWLDALTLEEIEKSIRQRRGPAE